jgi:RpiB/LacA/LacB family sugar-phosphate isomerase
MSCNSCDDVTVALASDHAGFQLKEIVKEHLSGRGVNTLDLGTDSMQSVDYPDYARKVCEGVLAGDAGKGILICGTGLGMAMMANRFKGIRAALCHLADLIDHQEHTRVRFDMLQRHVLEKLQVHAVIPDPGSFRSLSGKDSSPAIQHDHVESDPAVVLSTHLFRVKPPGWHGQPAHDLLYEACLSAARRAGEEYFRSHFIHGTL